MSELISQTVKDLGVAPEKNPLLAERREPSDLDKPELALYRYNQNREDNLGQSVSGMRLTF